MTEQHTEHRQYEGDYYSQTHTDLSKKSAPGRFGAEDQRNVQDGVDARTQQAAANYSVTQGDHLLQGQSTRADAPAPDTNYAAQDHQSLYNMVHTDLDAADIDAKGRVTNDLGNWLSDLSNSVNDATKASGIAWQGDGAAQAHGFFQNTATYTAQTADAAQLSSNRYSQQAAAADYAQKNMPKPSGFNQQAEIEKATVQYATGDPAAGAQTMTAVAAKQQQAAADHDQAVQVLHGLDSTYHGTATTQPAYSAPPQIGAADSSTHISSADAGGGVGTHGSGVGGPGGSSYNPAGGQPGGGQPGVGTGAGSSYAPPGAGASTGAGNVGGPPGGGGGFRGPGGGGTFGRFGPETVAMGGPAGGGGGGGGDITRSRPGIGTGRSGGGFAGSRVSGGGYKPGEIEEPGKGNSSGKGGAGERLERGGTAAANAGKGGKPGEAGAGGTGAGKKKDEDKEHKNKIPIQEDPDEVFEIRPERGPDGEKITPPVIGG